MGDAHTRYVITLTRRPEVPMGESLVRAHVEFLQELEARGQLELAGPFEDGEGGMYIIRADDLEAAQAISAADPFIVSGAESCEVRTWLLSCQENNHMGMGS